MRKHFKSRFPAFNIPRQSEEVATDTIFSETPAIDSGVMMAPTFVGQRNLVTDVYPLKSQKQFVNTLEDNIRFRGAMTKLISDYAKFEISNKFKDILRMYHSSSWNSEPYHQNQNPAEGRYCTIKSWTNTRTVSVTGIDNHELPGLDIVTCAALVQTNHGKVVLIMHEYAYYGRGNTIHSPGQIEWFQNTCDDKSFHVGGKHVINFLDGYSTPLQCRTGLMYMSLLGQPPDADLDTYPHVLLSGPHEWDPSVLDYTHPTTSGDATWLTMTPG